MLKIVVITDKKGSAIWRLAQGMQQHMQNIDYKVLDYHPKRADAQQMADFEREAIDADILDFQYFRTAQAVLEKYPWAREKKKILQHHNPYSIEEDNWNQFDMVVANNKSIYERLGKITESPVEYVGNTVDTDFWLFNTEWQPNRNILMVCARIEGKKGILPVAQACKKLGLNFHLVGSISDGNYFREIMQEGVIFHENISDEDLRKIYYNSTITVCNSVDGFESGPNITLESMLCGTPVLTRLVGHMVELNNGDNMIINEGQSEDVENLIELLGSMLADSPHLFEMRDKAWQTAKGRSNAWRAREYQIIYRKVLNPKQTSVSVIVPIYDKPEIIRKNLDAVARQTYGNIELIVMDDSVGEGNEQLVKDFSRYVGFPVRYINSSQIIIDREHPDGYKAYGLNRARNIGADKATGDILILDDQRMIMEPDCVEEFVKHMKPRYWLFGDKGANKDTFIENLSAVYKQDFINAGHFNERCDMYGSTSQEVRYRIRNQGLKTEFVREAKAIPTGKSSNRNRKRAEIIKSKLMLREMGLGE